MKRFPYVTLCAIAVLATLLICSPAPAEITLSGDLEINTSYIATDDDSADQKTTEFDSSGRIKIAPTVRKESGNLYMEALAQILANTDGTVATDDVWGKIGTSTFDVQIGRFEGWDLFAKSNDMLIVDAPNGVSRYETNYSRGRFGAPGQIAVHILPNDAFKMELGIVYGQDEAEETYTLETEETTRTAQQNYVGVRPVVDLTFGNVEALVGIDYLNITDQDNDWDAETNKFGYGGRVQATFGIVTLNINYAHGVVGGTEVTSATDAGDITTDDKSDETTDSFGGFCDLALGEGVLTLAGIYSTWTQDDNDYDKNHIQYYAAYAHPLPIEGATIKFAASLANATQESADGDIDSSASGFKVRLNYDF